MKLKILLSILLFALSFPPDGAADIFIYRDSQGVLHFSNVPNHAGFRPFVSEGRGGFLPLAPGRIEELIRSASQRYGVDPHLVRAIIKVESDFDARARSDRGAQGLMQLMPETARLHKVSNAYDPDENIEGGVRHLRFLLDRYNGDLRLTLAAYNAGVKAVEKYQGIPPFPETQEYVRRVLHYHRRYGGRGMASARGGKR